MNLAIKRSIYSLQKLAAFLLIAGFFGTGAWSYSAKLAGAVIAPAHVIVDGNPTRVQHLSGGTVAEVLVKDGDTVTIGQPILKLDATEVEAQHAAKKSELAELAALRARLICERDGCQDFERQAPSGQHGNLLETTDEKIWESQFRLMKARNQAKFAKEAQLRQRLVQVADTKLGLQAQNESITQQLKLIQRELIQLRILQSKDLVSTNRILSVEREEQRLLGEQGRLTSEANRLTTVANETTLQLAELEEHALSEVLSELRQVESKISQALQQEKALASRLKSTLAVAPRSGIIHNMTAATPGSVLKPGELISEIIPSDSRLTLEARVEPHSIDRVQTGQTCTLRFSAFDRSSTPELSGRVVRVSPDTIKDEQTGRDYYTVAIDLLSHEIAKLEDKKLRPGMLVEAHIMTPERSIISYLTKPFVDQMARAMRER